MDNCIVWRVEGFAIIGICQHGYAAIMLIAHYASPQMLTGDLATLPVEGVAVAMTRRIAKDAYMVTIL
jgi:hypothetical protein